MNNATRFTNLEVQGDLEARGNLWASGNVYTAGEVKANGVEVAAGFVQGMLTGNRFTSAVDTTLAQEKRYFYVGLEMSAASKTLTLDLPDGYVCLVCNEGDTNAFTLKNVSGDTGTSLGTGKVALVVANRTADKTIVKVLN